MASSLAVCLALGGWAAPARAGGLIPTERLAAAPASPHAADGEPAVGPSTAPAAPAGAPLPADLRAELGRALVAGGVAPAEAARRVDALTDAEVARLVRELPTAPAGGLWFVPFLVVAAVVGALIGSRASNAKASSDLFGRSGPFAAAP
ncbi:hypothetical protein ISF6_0900 [Piscinibacter sakaiensis]|uniref:Uncharacterized protein n=1 Tax=Piscinibacter sakaiensis TaxID=1547922 RepID=A0A0K8NYE0_PISS1|nr:hypothetical protein ISF6_0900 [Piscinibacter sakaiensis]